MPSSVSSVMSTMSTQAVCYSWKGRCETHWQGQHLARTIMMSSAMSSVMSMMSIWHPVVDALALHERQFHVHGDVCVSKAILCLPGSTSNDFIYLPTDRAGLGYKSLVPTYAQVAAETLITSLNDKESLGALIRSLRDHHLKALPAKERREGACLGTPLDKWRTHRSAAMCLRQSAWLTAYGMLLDQPTASADICSIDTATNIKEAVEDGIRRCGIRTTTEQVHELVLKPLWRLGIHNLGQLCLQSPQTPTQESTQKLPLRPDSDPAIPRETHAAPDPNSASIRNLHHDTTVNPAYQMMSW